VAKVNLVDFVTTHTQTHTIIYIHLHYDGIEQATVPALVATISLKHVTKTLTGVTQSKKTNAKISYNPFSCNILPLAMSLGLKMKLSLNA